MEEITRAVFNLTLGEVSILPETGVFAYLSIDQDQNRSTHAHTADTD
jgi:hypothetical protein